MYIYKNVRNLEGATSRKNVNFENTYFFNDTKYIVTI